MPLIRDTELVRIDLPADGEWVEVKPRPSRADQLYVQHAVLKEVVQGDQPGVALSNLTFGALLNAELAQMERAIKRWSFEEPVDARTIGMLDPESAEVIKVRLNELWGGRSDAEKNDSSGSGADSSSATAGLPLSSDG